MSHIGIMPLFMADHCRFTVAGVDCHIGGQCEDLAADTVNEQLVIAGDKVGAAYAPLEKHIAGNGPF